MKLREGRCPEDIGSYPIHCIGNVAQNSSETHRTDRIQLSCERELCSNSISQCQLKLPGVKEVGRAPFS